MGVFLLYDYKECPAKVLFGRSPWRPGTHRYDWKKNLGKAYSAPESIRERFPLDKAEYYLRLKEAHGINSVRGLAKIIRARGRFIAVSQRWQNLVLFWSKWILAVTFYLEERGNLDKAYTLEAEKGAEALWNALLATVKPERFVKIIAEKCNLWSLLRLKWLTEGLIFFLLCLAVLLVFLFLNSTIFFHFSPSLLRA